MSDPVTNLEIEDVLSSIRRLVAEGDKLRTSPQPAAQPMDVSPEALVLTDREPIQDTSESEPDLEPQAEKFVLTSAFRVDETPSSTVVVWDDAEDQAAVDDRTDDVSTTNVLDVEAEQVNLQVEDAESDEVALVEETLDELPADDHFDLGKSGSEEHQSSDVEAANLENSSEATVDSPVEVTEGRSRLEMTIAELEAAITGKAEDWEPDGSETTPVMDWATPIVEPAFLSSRHGAKSAEIEDAEEIQETKPFVLRVSAHEDLEPEAPTNELADDLDRSEPGALEGELDKTLTAYLEEEEILDEETLRNLVVEIVRQELQGTLGERITRNVRKLVRREINRVLSSEEFD